MPKSDPYFSSRFSFSNALSGLKEFVFFFNNGNFFEAHEHLEDLWRKTVGKNKDTLRGLIQLAVALHHAEHKNKEGAFKEFALARKKLILSPPTFLGIQISKLVTEADTYFHEYPTQKPSHLPKITTIIPTLK